MTAARQTRVRPGSRKAGLSYDKTLRSVTKPIDNPYPQQRQSDAMHAAEAG
jgi:hypothetical protein